MPLKTTGLRGYIQKAIGLLDLSSGGFGYITPTFYFVACGHISMTY